MPIIAIEPYSIVYQRAVCTGDCYLFSPAFFVDIGQVHSEDSMNSTSSGCNQFRVDYTKIGRYECEFLDGTFGYRRESEVTLLATPQGAEWALNTSIPSGIYHGCAVVVLLDKLTQDDLTLFGKLGIDLGRIIKALNVDQRWLKFLSLERLLAIFSEMYAAHYAKNRERVFLKALEVLVHISQCESDALHRRSNLEFFAAHQVRAVKRIHAFLLSHYGQSIVMEELARRYDIAYSLFNKIFKAVYGESPYQYLKKLRVEQAAKALLETDSNILEIANQVGYSNPSKFSSAFKSVVGALPRTFRKEQNGMEHFSS